MEICNSTFMSEVSYLGLKRVFTKDAGHTQTVHNHHFPIRIRKHGRQSLLSGRVSSPGSISMSQYIRRGNIIHVAFELTVFLFSLQSLSFALICLILSFFLTRYEATFYTRWCGSLRLVHRLCPDPPGYRHSLRYNPWRSLTLPWRR